VELSVSEVGVVELSVSEVGVVELGSPDVAPSSLRSVCSDGVEVAPRGRSETDACRSGEKFIQSYRRRVAMSSDRQSVPVSLPSELVDRLDGLVEDGVFGSRSEALRYGARLVVREERLERVHDRTTEQIREDVDDRLERKRVS
jgi:Arc/MetJ-type ribon-helix-helix transcriptional regulator